MLWESASLPTYVLVSVQDHQCLSAGSMASDEIDYSLQCVRT